MVAAARCLGLLLVANVGMSFAFSPAVMVPMLVAHVLRSSGVARPRSTTGASLMASPRRVGQFLSLRASAEGGSQPVGGKCYEVVESHKEVLVVMEIGNDIKAGNIECEIGKRVLKLAVSGQRIIDAQEMWGAVDLDASFWEIDEYKGKDRCIIVRLVKKLPGEWQFLLKSDYTPETVLGSRGRITRGGPVSKAEVEEALQLIVTLMRPPIEGSASNAPNAKTAPSEKYWSDAVKGAVDDEWKDTGKEMKEAMEKGASPDQIQDLLSMTQEALQGAEGPTEVSKAPITALMFVRHAKTLPAEDNSVDADLGRMLTDEGRAGAAQARRWFNTMARNDAKIGGVAFSSGAGRCLETAFLMGSPVPCVLEGVYDGLNLEGARKAFDECGYAPLAEYVGKGHGGVLRGYAERALVELADGIKDEIERRREVGGGEYLGTVCVFGHAVYSAAMAMLVAQALKLTKEDLDLVARCVHGESEGILVTAVGTGHCNSDAAKLDEMVDMRTARALSKAYASFKATGLM